jgi:hypothetical protein
MAAAFYFDCAAPFEIPQNARDSLNRKPEVIRDMLTGHR